MARLIALGALLALGSLVRSQQLVGVCNLPFCECSPDTHPSWTIVNCTVPPGQTLDFLDGELPESTTDLVVSGGETVLFGTNALTKLKDARRIYVSGARLVLIRRFAAINIDVVRIFLEIHNCEVLRIEERAFTDIKGPLSVTISDCNHLSIEGEAFSWLLTASISNVPHAHFGSGAFVLDPTAANVDEHGPGMAIDLKNMTLQEFPAQTFGSSAASITMDNVIVHAIRAGAFNANTYNVITAINCSFHLIEPEAFTQKSLINNLHFQGSKVHELASKALQSAVANLNISHSRFENIETGAINATVAAVVIIDSVFQKFEERGFELSSWNKLQMERNTFDELAPNAIVAPGVSIHELVFNENVIDSVNAGSLGFIGQAHQNSANKITYNNNFYGQPCHCNISSWLGKALATEMQEPFISQSFCTVDDFFARCFNVPEQNIQFKKFLDDVCNEETSIKCEPYKTKIGEKATEIHNPKFPHKNREGGLTDRNKKVIGIVIVTIIGCIIIVLFISFIRWMRRRGHCATVKDVLSSNTSCGLLCERVCTCGLNSVDNVRSISELSVNEYSERHRLNEPRVQENVVQETTLPNMYVAEDVVPVEDKTTQTLPEELTKELLENLKEKLEDPENYVEAREMIEHLYELIKVEESCNTNAPVATRVEENIYDLPFQNTTPRIGKNKKQMISIGTRTPSLDKLTPLSPYNRQTALAHEYFEPKDFAVHLYAEIANCDKDKRNLLGSMPDVVLEQPVPRGPYLRAVRDKMNTSAGTSSASPPPHHNSTIKSNKSNASNSSRSMLNRPLPAKPAAFDPGEGVSFKHG